MAPAAVLMGPPGAGKTTVGQAVARLLGVAFADTDQLIEERAGKPIPEIFFDDGEAVFRALERETIASSLESFDGVLALGGGAILDPGTRDLLRPHTVFFLSVELAAAVKRVGLDTARPLLLGNVRGRLLTLLNERAVLYAEVATETIDTDALAPDAVAELILATTDG